VEQLGAWSGTEGIQALTQTALKLVGSHGREAKPFRRRPVYRRACPGTFTNAGAPRGDFLGTTFGLTVIFAGVGGRP
jgi:hypothetical protein